MDSQTENPVVAYCRTCGKPLPPEERIWVNGAAFCADHAPVSAGNAAGTASGSAAGSAAGNATYDPFPPAPSSPASPYTSYANHEAVPALALFLGIIPGVGAIYNGQYAKGLIHAVIFGFIVTVLASGGAFLGLFIPLLVVWCFYMVIEAFHTARKRRDGIPVDEFSSLINFRPGHGGFPLAPIILIGLGVIFLLQTMDLLPLERLVRYWPLLLIIIGVYSLYQRMNRPQLVAPEEIRHER